MYYQSDYKKQREKYIKRLKLKQQYDSNYNRQQKIQDKSN